MLFNAYDTDSPELNDAHHLAAMTALLGPPPPEFFGRRQGVVPQFPQRPVLLASREAIHYLTGILSRLVKMPLG